MPIKLINIGLITADKNANKNWLTLDWLQFVKID
jgi:hypothetical protein